MAGLGQLAKLTTRGVNPEPFSGGGRSGLKWDDIAASLRGIDDPAYWYARAVFCQDNAFTERLMGHLTCMALTFMRDRGIKPRAHSGMYMAEGIATIALFSECWKRRCTHLYCHEGRVKGGKLCPVCAGQRTVGMATGEKLSIGKFDLDRSSYERTWEPIERQLQGVFGRWRAEILAEMDANLGDAEAA